MDNCIFYNNEPYFQENLINIPYFVTGEAFKIKECLFNTKEGVFSVVYRENTPLFICKKINNPDHQDNEHPAHKLIVSQLGVIVEFIDCKVFENIQLLFASKSYSDTAKIFVEDDYRDKIKSNSDMELLSINNLVYLGEESDGLKYFYDQNGSVFIYTDDRPLTDEKLIPLPNQPVDTFYTREEILSVNDILLITFK